MSSSITYQLKKPAASMIILWMTFQMLRDFVDSVCQNCNLHFSRSCILRVLSVLFDNFLFFVSGHFGKMIKNLMQSEFYQQTNYLAILKVVKLLSNPFFIFKIWNELIQFFYTPCGRDIFISFFNFGRQSFTSKSCSLIKIKIVNKQRRENID